MSKATKEALKLTGVNQKMYLEVAHSAKLKGRSRTGSFESADSNFHLGGSSHHYSHKIKEACVETLEQCIAAEE